MATVAEFYPGPVTQGTRFGSTNATPLSVGSPLGMPVPQTAAYTGAGLPSPVTWLLGVVVLLVLLKFLSEHERSSLNPAHIAIGGYNVLTIFVIVMLTVVGMKIVVNRPAFSRGPLAGFASLVNAT